MDIETFPNPNAERNYTIQHIQEEFTSTCPMTGHPDYATVDLGDPRVRASKDLKQLVYETFEDANIKIEPAVFELYASPSALAREAAGFFYASFVLSDQTHRQMLEDLELLFAVQPIEPSRFALPVNRLTVTAGINS